MLELKDLKFEYIDKNRVYEVQPDIIEMNTFNNIKFTVIIYDKKLNWYVLRVDYTIFGLEDLSCSDLNNIKYDSISRDISFHSKDYADYFIDTIGSYVQPKLPDDSDVIKLLKNFIEFKNINVSKIDDKVEEKSINNYRPLTKLTKEDRSKILDEIGVLLNSIIYDKGYKDGLKYTGNIPKERIVRMVNEIKDESDTIHLIDRDVDYISLEVLFKIINKYCGD